MLGPDDTPIEDRRTLLAALERLTPRERAVVVLRHLDDHPERDVADMLNVSIGTAKATCFRALRKLRVWPCCGTPCSDRSLIIV